MVVFREIADGVNFSVRVIPRSSRSAIVGEYDGALKIKISSPPVEGAANNEVTKLLAKTFKVAPSQVEIVSGQTSKAKQIQINGVTAEQAKTLLGL